MTDETAARASGYPKIELHVHLEGAIRPATLLALAKKNNAVLPVSTLAELEAFYEFDDFEHFIDVWTVTTDVLDDADDFRRVVVDYAKEAASFGAVYLEGIVSPSQYYLRGIEGRELFEGFTDGIQEAWEQTGVRVRLTPDIDRGRPVELSRQVIDDAILFRDRGIVGIGLGGRERAAPASTYTELFQVVRDAGLASVPHAGEDDGPQSVRDAIDLLGASRVRHGIRAADDPALMQELVERGIVLDVSITSNLRTKVTADVASHPLPRLLAAGVGVTINTDDPAMFGTDLGHEHELALGLGATPRDMFLAGVAGQVGGAEIGAWLEGVGAEAWPAGAAGAPAASAAHDAAPDAR
ncbi:adenosine deaminase [Subtercola vilae]|uniref:Adenosine deaminase n=1 Tax=Subtercola vilae TaxID=2056433 RepID=A0A4T2BST4_9MICO|nr:adenosine deaminase [Subtercola vilae]TIH34823.1 adenosine deaminase [Subtercola vilae]